MKHPTGRCEFRGQEETLEHVMMQCQKYEVERRELSQSLGRIKMKLDLRDERSSMDECFRVLVQYFRGTNLTTDHMNLFYLILLIFSFDSILEMELINPDPHSITVGGGNAFKVVCQPP